LLLDGNPRGVASGKTVVEEDGPSAGRSRLQQGSHFARMERVNACVVVSGNELTAW
jgi:hypothetical protein